MRSWPRLAVSALALTIGCTACNPSSNGANGDTTVAPTTLLDISPTTAGPPTTPIVTAYPTIPMVTAVVPYWSPVGWSVAQVKSYLEMVDSALNALGAEHSMDANNGMATLDNGTRIDLTLLAARLTVVAPSTWQAAVSTYLASILSPDQPDTALTFEIAQPMLRVRVGTLGSLGLSLEQGVVQPIIDDLMVAVCVEQSTSTTYLTPAQLDAWGKTADEILTLAIEQTLARPVTTKRSGLFTTAVGDQFASTRLLDPSAVMGGSPPDGFLVVIPSLDQFVAIPVDKTLTTATITAMVHQAAEDFNNLNNPASPDLYWWRNGTMQVLHPQGDEVVIPSDLQALISP